MSCLLQHAEAAAQRVVDALAPVCAKIEIAGSIRRNRPIVKDIEIVCLPKSSGLFEDTPDYEAFELALNRHIKDGLIVYDTQVKRDGDRYKRFRMAGVDMVVDLFIAAPGRYGNILAIRTGNSRFSELLVASRSTRILCNDPGEDGLKHYGLMPHNMRQTDGFLWRDGKRIECPTEHDFFAAIGVPWIEPRQRDLDGIERLRKAAPVAR